MTQSIHMKLPYFLVVVDSVLLVFALEVPLVKGALTPGFTSTLLLGNPTFAITYLVSLAMIGLTWYLFGQNRMVSLLLGILFAVAIIDVWVLKVPGFYYPTDPVTEYATLTSGHINFTLLDANTPIMFLLASSIITLTGSTLRSGLEASVLITPIIYATMSYAIAQRFLKEPKLVMTTVALSIIADAQFSKVPPFNHDVYGVVYYLVAVVSMLALLDSAGPRTIQRLVFFITFACAIISYPLAGFIILLFFIFLALRGSVLYRFHSARRVYFGTTATLGTMLAVYFTWNIYVNSYFSVYNLLIGSITNFFSPVAQSPGAGSSGGLAFYLSQLLLSGVRSLPFPIGYLLPFWFVFLFPLGVVIWLGLKIRGSYAVPSSVLILPLLITGVLLFLIPGGAEWIRALPYLGLFLSIVVVIAAARVKGLVIGLTILILLLTLPTAVAYYPQVGTIGGVYRWELTTGTFVQAHSSGGDIFYGTGLATITSAVLISRLVPILSSSPATSSGAVVTMKDTLDQWESSHGAILVFGSLYYSQFFYLYGYSNQSEVYNLVSGAVASKSLVYTTGLSQLYV